MSRNALLALIACVGLASTSAAWIFAGDIAGAVICLLTILLVVGVSQETS